MKANKTIDIFFFFWVKLSVTVETLNRQKAICLEDLFCWKRSQKGGKKEIPNKQRNFGKPSFFSCNKTSSGEVLLYQITFVFDFPINPHFFCLYGNRMYRSLN